MGNAQSSKETRLQYNGWLNAAPVCVRREEEPLSSTLRPGTVTEVTLNPHYWVLCVWEQLLLELREQEE